MDDSLVVWMLLGLMVGIVAGQLLIIVFDYYQSYKTSKEIAARNHQYDKERASRLERGELEPPFGGGSFAFTAYRDLAKAERERELNKPVRVATHMPVFDSWQKHMKESMSNTSSHNKPDRLLRVMQDFFVELRERDKTNDKTSQIRRLSARDQVDDDGHAAP